MKPSKRGPGGPDAWGIQSRLWQLMQGVLDESAPALGAIGLNPKAFFVLAAVEELPFPAELARAMHLPPPTVTYLVKQMEAAGYLERRAEPGDLRKFRLVLTEAGRRAVVAARGSFGSVMAARLARLSAEEVATFDGLLGRLAPPPDDST